MSNVLPLAISIANSIAGCEGQEESMPATRKREQRDKAPVAGTSGTTPAGKTLAGKTASGETRNAVRGKAKAEKRKCVFCAARRSSQAKKFSPA